MSREIKFRSWDGDRMVYDDSRSIFAMFEGTESPIMQYTGLKDKNGKEIYEGDIVKLNGYQLTVDWCASAWKLIKNNSEVLCGLGEWDDYWGGEEEAKIEIIGNIYENPELLHDSIEVEDEE